MNTPGKMRRGIALVVERVREFVFESFAIPKARGYRVSRALIGRYLPSNAVIVDCGAHDGADTIAMARRWRGATLYAFEPVPSIFERLVENTRRYSNIKCYPVAISDLVGKQVMHISGGESDASSSLLEPRVHLQDHPTVVFNESREVSTTTFEAWARAEGLPRVDMFWLDMQGSEMQALAASPELLRTARVVYTEVSMRETYAGVPLYPEFRAWMEQQGFIVALEAIPDGWDVGNVLFVKDA